MVTEQEPDLKLLGLSIWVDGRQFPGNSDYYDGNWLNGSNGGVRRGGEMRWINFDDFGLPAISG